MGYLLLFLAIICEIIGTSFMKASNGFSNVKSALLIIPFWITALVLFNFAIKQLGDVGKAYAIWCGVGMVFIAAIGVLYFKETISLPKIIFITMIIVGVAGLSLIETKPVADTNTVEQLEAVQDND